MRHFLFPILVILAISAYFVYKYINPEIIPEEQQGYLRVVLIADGTGSRTHHAVPILDTAFLHTMLRWTDNHFTSAHIYVLPVDDESSDNPVTFWKSTPAPAKPTIRAKSVTELQKDYNVYKAEMAPKQKVWFNDSIQWNQKKSAEKIRFLEEADVILKSTYNRNSAYSDINGAILAAISILAQEKVFPDQDLVIIAFSDLVDSRQHPKPLPEIPSDVHFIRIGISDRAGLPYPMTRVIATKDQLLTDLEETLPHILGINVGDEQR